MTHPFITHNGGPCPVSGEAIVDIEFRNGDIVQGYLACQWRLPTDYWQWQGDPENDVVAYRLHQPDEGEAS
jgi:hypothetical protein